MKSCSEWMEAIADSAAGAELSADLARHLEICPKCESALREGRATAARIDQALHRTAAVEPPIYGPERVMALVGGGQARAWWRWAAAGSAVAAALIGIAIWVRRPAPEANIPTLSTWRSPTQALLRPPVAAAWTTAPRLGEGFFKISGETHVH